MGTVHVTDGRVSGGKTGSIICGIIVAVFFNYCIWNLCSNPESHYYLESLDLGTLYRVIFTILSIVSIPFAVIVQKVTSYIYDMIRGEYDFQVATLDAIIIRKFAGALAGAIVFNIAVLFVICTFNAE